MKKQKTAALKRAYNNYKNSTDYDLYDAYERPSFAKKKAWKYCRSLCEEMNGSSLKVVGHNTTNFSAGFTAEVEGEKVFVWITKEYDRMMPIGE